MVNDSIIKSVKSYLSAVNDQGIKISFGVIFGSQARGEATKWSDVDLLVVSPEFDTSRDRKKIDNLWHITALTDSRIEPIPCGEKQWQEDDSSAIIEIARREGEIVRI
ncbi:MAG: nucleotidyltransferase domain-containing protein [Candidatus Poribacteria bacterium]